MTFLVGMTLVLSGAWLGRRVLVIDGRRTRIVKRGDEDDD